MSFVDAAASVLLGDAEAPYALFSSAQRSIGYLFPDVTVREAHSDEDTITVHPVETGTPISDHVFANPKIVEITFGFSDSSGGYAGYVQDQYQAILALKATHEPFDVSTGKRFYENMLFGNVLQVTDEQFEFAGMFTVRLQEVIITSTDGGAGSDMTAGNQADPASTAPETDAGNQTLQINSPPAENNAGFGSVASGTSQGGFAGQPPTNATGF